MSDQGLGIIVAGAVGAYGNVKDRRSFRQIGPSYPTDGSLPVTIVANVTVEEKHQDDLEITEHPVEQGGAITDHAFKKPAEVTVRMAWSNSSSAPQSLSGGTLAALGNKLSGSLQNQLTGVAQQAIGGSALGNLAVAKLGTLISSTLTSFGSQVNSGQGRGTTRVEDIYATLLQLQSSAVPFDLYTGKRKYSNMLIKSMVTETTRETENALVVLLTLKQVIIVQTTLNTVTASPANQASPQLTAPPIEAGTKQVIQTQPVTNMQLAQTLLQLF